MLGLFLRFQAEKQDLCRELELTNKQRGIVVNPFRNSPNKFGGCFISQVNTARKLSALGHLPALQTGVNKASRNAIETKLYAPIGQ